MRASIDVEDNRVFLCRVEICRQKESVPVVVLAVRALDRAEKHFSGLVCFERILSCDEIADQLSVAGHYVCDARHIEAAVVVDVLGAVFVEADCVPAFLGRQSDWFAEFGFRYDVLRDS